MGATCNKPGRVLMSVTVVLLIVQKLDHYPSKYS